MVPRMSSIWGSARRIVSCLVFTSFVLSCPGAKAQEREGDSQFHVAVSQKLGFGGFETETHFMLVDEFGFRYDTMSLLANGSVKDSIGLTDDKFEELSNSWQATKKEMDDLLVGAIASDEKRDQIKAMFLESQETLRSLLDVEQQEKLTIATERLAIEEYGVGKYLQTKRVQSELELTDTQVGAIKEANSKFGKSWKRELSELNRAANSALVEELAESQQQTLKTLLSEKSFDDFLNAKLFVSQKSAASESPDVNVKKNRGEIFGACLIGKVRKSAKIDSDQYGQLRRFRRSAMKLDQAEFEEELGAILTSDQTDVLKKTATEKQLANLGTVNSISKGVLASQLGINDEQADSLFEFGKRLHQDLVVEAREIKKQAVNESFKDLSEDQVLRLSKLIDVTDPLKKPR
ncbi:MAG: hypothetical protein AB8B55_00550 [Mariniblastus sp.]